MTCAHVGYITLFLWGQRYPLEDFRDRIIILPHHRCSLPSFLTPFAHRANIVRSLKGLEHIVQLVGMDYKLHPTGWSFSGPAGTAAQDPIYSFKRFSELYLKADSEYKGRYSVPVLCDREEETIVNNESPEIVRMIYSGFWVRFPAAVGDE